MHLSVLAVIFLRAEAFIQPIHFYVAIALFSGLITVMVTVMVSILIRKNRIAMRRKQLQLQFKDWLVGIILEEPDEEHPGFEVPVTIQVVLKQKFARQELLQELKRLRNSLSGQPGDNLEMLYRQLGLAEVSARSLRSRQWYRKTKGIQELAVMNQTKYTDEIYPLTNHPHPVVRMEAQIALVFLQQYQGLHFFERLVYPLTEWHQMKLLQLLATQPLPAEAEVLRWLRSPNASVVQFTLKLIGEQHASSFQEDVIACLHHPKEFVCRQAIMCLGDIPSTLAAKALQNFFGLITNTNLRLTILAELSKTGTTDDLPFLQELLQAPDAEIRLAAEKVFHHLQSQLVAA